MSNLDFERIYLNQSKANGRFRIAESGLGWKAASTGGSANKTQPFLLPSDELSSAQWSRGSRGWELRIQTKNKGVAKLDGFDQQDFNQLKNELQRLFNIQLDHKEHSLRGWNWGNTDLARNELVFNVSGKPAFEISYNQINNSNLAAKNEVAIDMNLINENNDTAGDELVELRFYIPGTVPYEDDDVAEEDREEKTSAAAFYDQLKEKADIGQVAGEALASFTDILFLTPRGRFDIDLYPSYLRLRGKTYDHKIQYRQVERIFSLPKPDDIHHLMVIHVNPPLRQGQTPYPYLVLQFAKDEELEVEINVSEEEFKEKYEGRLKKRYDQQTHLVLSHVFRGLTERRIIIPGSFTSKHGQAAVSCSLKVNEGYLYLLEKCFLFVTKPTVYVPYNDVQSVSISRAGDSSTSNRTFDLEVTLRSTSASHTFANISKDEQSTLESFLKEKGLRVKNDDIEQQARINAVLANEMDSSDDDVRMGSASDDESPDEDFQGESDDSDSDLAEEFDSDAPGSDDEAEGPPSKKPKN
ncbi:hypothetical protein WICANDRAFT_91746 [Wickerhamomyces anomalus NRRL Y-366-8]|uniref:FACT complex subunit POB3 n=1 Tax=Wickerhamomyces anomalus (strain ATCC 58044 / CBS 1984 / NCYC 433 / NRRL Y-366-8) TaxID=683960 RepID=A0A1E3P3N5_WICAA|nr:uncharacterized protein WICANDRAFT_91746 [Wickerhamomyces anomalus NRRL Y-366-8]ODQ59814.1 hypothetical protein WICANDRAFT_91746 [Wickerhamomyces anomalus NRRL Y-366-8]